MTIRTKPRSFFSLALVMLIAGFSMLNLAFSRASAVRSSAVADEVPPVTCQQAASEQLLSLDGVDLQICLPFLPDVIVGASETDSVQSLVALNGKTRQEFSIYVVPYGLQPASDNLPAAGPDSARVYQDLSFQAYAGEILADFEARPVNLFGQTVTGRSVVIENKIGSMSTGQQLITQWVAEAGSRVWLIRSTLYADSFLDPDSRAIATQALSLLSSTLDRPSLSLRLASETEPAGSSEVTASATDLPFPAWWKGDCDVNNFPGSYPLGASYRAVKTCGPTGTFHLVNFGAGVSQYEWQCVEYVKRYLYLAHGIAPYSANGNTVVWNYSGTRLEKVTNGTPNKGPIPGDVISYNGPSTYGHASLVIAANIDPNGNGTVTIAEQNYSKTGSRTHTVTNWAINSSDGVSGWLHDYQQTNNPPAGFSKCADEGGFCNLTGPAEVVYGARDSFTAPRLFTSGVDCENAVFGDPLGGVGKACYSKTVTPDEQISWSALYFDGQAHWVDPANTTGQMCAETLASSGLDKNYGAAAPCGNGISDDWVAEYNATINFASGNYIFQAQNNDGIKVWVNNQNLFERSGSADLSAACPALSLDGSTPIRVILREETGDARLRLLWTTDAGVCALPGSFGKVGPTNGATWQSISPTISWSASRNVNTYSYCLDTSSNTICDTGWQDAGALTSKALAGLAYNTTYYWQVRSNNSAGETAANGGAWWSFTTRLDPAGCFALTRTHTGNGADPLASPGNGTGCDGGQYRAGDVISLIASPASDSRVGSWSGTDNNASTSTTNTAIMPAQPHTVTVNYVRVPPAVPVSISPNGTILDDLHPIYKWYASTGATSYYLTVYNEDKAELVMENVSVPASLCSGSPAVCSYHPEISLGNYHYAFKVAAVNLAGNSPFSPWRSFYIARVVTTYISIKAQDGYLVESTETSALGGWFYAANNGFYVGDGLMDRQRRAILSFDTSSLPDTAVILVVKLKLEKQAVVGVDPMTTHGGLIIDIKRNYFGTSPALGLDDFSAPAGQNFAGSIGKIPAGTRYTGTFAPAAFTFFNRTGMTQLRLRFQLDDNNNDLVDSIAFFSGEAYLASKRPTLEISYYVP